MPEQEPERLMKYRVKVNILDRIVHSAGFKDDGTPKKKEEHHRGDVITFPGYEEDDVQRLVDLKAIEPIAKSTTEPTRERKGGVTPSAGQTQRRAAQGDDEEKSA